VALLAAVAARRGIWSKAHRPSDPDTPAMRRRLDALERRARIAARHQVAAAHGVEHVVDAAGGVVCLRATDPASVYLATQARLADPSQEVVDRAPCMERELVRMLAMRRTVFVVSAREVATLHAAVSLDVGRTERPRNGHPRRHCASMTPLASCARPRRPRWGPGRARRGDRPGALARRPLSPAGGV
jgi:hypothetical protein